MDDRRGAIVGAAAWILTLQFFLVQGVVQSAWTTPFSLAHNMISDLARETCGPLRRAPGIEVACSPWHALMNASIIANGILIPLGAFLTRRLWPSCREMRIALWMLALTAPAHAPGRALPLRHRHAGAHARCGHDPRAREPRHGAGRVGSLGRTPRTGDRVTGPRHRRD